MHDLLNSQLLSLLEEDATQTSEKLAKQLHVSSSTIRRRMERLIQEGTLHIVAIPEPKNIGCNMIAVIAFQVQHEFLSSVLNSLKNRKNVKCLYATSGRYDVIALMWFSSTEELYEFREEDITQMDGVKDSETFVCMRCVKTCWGK
ncbi:Lrp/AsnC family transcriptional regulator [Chloroflexota bacterium]